MKRRTPMLLCAAATAVALFGTAACGGSDVKSSSSAGTGRGAGLHVGTTACGGPEQCHR